MTEEEQFIEPLPPEDGDVREAEEEAAAEAGKIGGKSGMEGMDPAERASAEHGGGVAEGFEQSEALLEEEATGEEGDPTRDAGRVEASADPATYGEADHEHSSENPPE